MSGLYVDHPADEAAATAELYARAKELRDTEAAWIRSRIPVDDSPAAERALRVDDLQEQLGE